MLTRFLVTLLLGCSVAFSLDYSTADVYDRTQYLLGASVMRTPDELFTSYGGTHSITLNGTYDSIRKIYKEKRTVEDILFTANMLKLSPCAPFGCQIPEIIRHNDVIKKIVSDSTTAYNSVIPNFKTGMTYLKGYMSQRMNCSDRSGKILASAYFFQNEGASLTDMSKCFNNLVIMADGLDPDNRRSIMQVTTDTTFSKLFYPTATTISGATFRAPMPSGYDLCFIDFADGGGDVRNNAKVMLFLVESIIKNNTGTNDVYVGGFSMGGVVSRLAMLYGQKTINGVATVELSTVRKYISIDAPQWGAEVPLDLQKIAYDVRADAPEGWNRLSQAASKQLLFENYDGKNPANPSDYTYEHDKFYNWMLTMNPAGYMPKRMVMYSLALSNWVAPYPASALGAKEMEFTTLKGYKGSVYMNSMGMQPGSSRDYFSQLTKSWFNIFGLYQVNKATATVYPAPAGSVEPTYKPTHIPITSAFCINPSTPTNLLNGASLQTLAEQDWSPFHKIALTSKRMEHIIFSVEVVNTIVSFCKDATLYNKYAKRTYPGGIFKRQAGQPELAGAVERTEFTVNTTGSNMIVSVPTALAGSPIAWSLFNLSGRQVLSSNGSIKARNRFIVDADSKVASTGKYVLKIISKNGVKSFPVFQM